MFKKTIASSASFLVGYSFFVKPWPEIKDHRENNPEIVSRLSSSKEFISTINNSNFELFDAIAKIPLKHQENHVCLGLLYGFKNLEIKPVFFKQKNGNEMISFYYLGENLVNNGKYIHNGILSTLIDEGLCVCGFPKLPSKRGVTAKLSINFKDKIKPNTMVVLKSVIKESKGRKCVISGILETVPSGNEKPIQLADCECILVEPTWFKYLNWIDVF